jgi:beta-lactamase superfamily II metal-dependent hydrolase
MLSLILLTSYFGDEHVAKATGPYLTVNVMDVNDSGYIVQLPNGKVMVVDAGTTTELQKVYDRLDDLNITTIDYLVGTHEHVDHIGNFNNIINSGKYTIGQVDFPKNSPCDNDDCTWMVNAANSNGIPVNYFNAGDSIFTTTTVNGLTLSTNVFSPTATSDFSGDYDPSTPAYVNAYSMVFNIQYGSKSFLFTGDALPPTQNEIMSNYSLSNQQVMTAPHHGYDFSVDDAFLDYVEAAGTDKIVIENMRNCGSPESFKYRLQTRVDEGKGSAAYWSINYNHDFYFQTDGTSWTYSSNPEWSPGDGLVSPAPYPSICDENPLGVWRFDETSGTTAADSSGNGHNGTLNAGASWTASGYTEGALKLNGSSTGYVTLPFVMNPQATLFTAAAMVKLDTSTAANQFILRQNGTNGRAWLYRDSSGHLSTFIGGSKTTSTGTIPTGTWTHVAVVYDGTNVQLYLNGVADGSPVARTGENSTANMYVGVDSGLNNAWNGEIDDLVIYNTALGSGNINNLYTTASYGQ